MDSSRNSTTTVGASPVVGGRPPVSFGREAAAAGIMVVLWGVISPVLNIFLDTYPDEFGKAMFVEAFNLLVFALLIGLLGATGRRWIAIFPAILAVQQAVLAAGVVMDVRPGAYGWLFLDTLIVSDSLYVPPSLLDNAVVLGMAFVAWAYGFGRKPWGLALAGLSAMVLLALRVAVIVVAIESDSPNGLGAVVAFSSVAVFFLVVIAASYLVGNSAFRMDSTGKVVDPGSGPRGGNIAALFGLLALLSVYARLAPVVGSAYFEQFLLTILAVGAVVVARDRRLPVGIVVAVTWVYFFVWSTLPAAINGYPLGGNWSWFANAVGGLPLFVNVMVLGLVKTIPVFVGIALTWALLRCRRVSDVWPAAGLAAVGLVLIWVVYAAFSSFLSVSISSNFSSGDAFFWRTSFKLLITVTWSLCFIVIAVVVHLFVRRSDAALQPQWMPAGAQPGAGVTSGAPWPQGPATRPEPPASKYPRAVGLTIPKS